MKMRFSILLLGFLPVSYGQDLTIQPVLESVAMFKNGLTVVKASFGVEQAGNYVWIDPPTTVHGAFYVEGEPGLVVRSTTRLMTPEGPQLPTGNLQRDLAGAIVSVSLAGESGRLGEVVTGKVWTVPEPERREWNTNYASTNAGGYGYFHSGAPSRTGALGTGGWLVLDTGGQRRFLATRLIGALNVVREPAEPVKERRAVLEFSIPKAGETQVTYLTKGMAWAPAYQVDLLAGDRLRLRQTAVVRNELMDLKKCNLELISGYPNIKFAHVDSPLSAQATLAGFFQQLSQEGGGRGNVMTQQMVMTNNAFTNVASNPVASLGPVENGAPAEDLHYENVGVHALNEGDSLSLEVARAETSCERIVEWNVPDSRDERGRLTRRGQREEDEPWDAVQFSNPLKFPMTTAAASVLEGGRFRGQSMATWTAPGQKASIKINKALTVRGEHSEVEEEGKREVVWIGGYSYQRTVVSGRLKVSNSRAESIKMVIRTDFSGDLLAAEGDPAKSLRADGARSVNPHRQLVWTLDLEGGKSKELTYRYSLLVNR